MIALEALSEALREDPAWREYLRSFRDAGSPPHALHLAVMAEPFLTHMLEGRKSIEARFTVRRNPPYGCVGPGDVVLLKQPGGAIVGICRVAAAWFYRLAPSSWKAIRSEFAEAMAAQDPEFWERRAGASYATLMRITEVRRIGPMVCGKRDRRGWVVLLPPTGQLPLVTA